MKRKSWFRKLFSGRQRSLRTGLVPASVFEVSGAEPARSRKRAGMRSRAVAGQGGGLASFLSVYGTCVLLAALTAAIPYAAYLGYRAVVAAGWLAVTEITVEGNDRLSA